MTPRRIRVWLHHRSALCRAGDATMDRNVCPFAHRQSGIIEIAMSLWMTSPPLPVASSVPELTIVFAPVSISSALVPVAMIVPLLTRVISPSPRCPAPEIVLSTLVSVTSETVPVITFSLLSDRSTGRRPQRDAVLDELQIGLASGRVQLDRAGVVDDAAQRQDRAVADHHVAGILGDRRLIKDEVVRGSDAASTPCRVIDWPSPSVITALPAASLAVCAWMSPKLVKPA